jgi:transcriptional regulator with GAF, ATPase, and Fis domain
LWLQMSGLTLGILLFALVGTLLYVRRITRPLAELAQATERIDAGEQGVRVLVGRQDEVGRLAASFNQMVAGAEGYTRKLEEQTMELDRAHRQTITSCRIVQEIGALRNLNEISTFLIKKIQDILKCNQMVLLIFNNNRDGLFILSTSGVTDLIEQKVVETAMGLLEGLKKATFTGKETFTPPLVPDSFQQTSRQAIIPLQHGEQLIGALVIACPGQCQCDGKEIDAVRMILTQASSILNRAVVQEEETRSLQSRIEITAEFCGIIGKDPEMQKIYNLIEDVSPTDATVLIQGESGTGKELVARAIHDLSPRKGRPFVVINCSAYPATLLESELFGHEKGAFTGAIRKKAGRFEQADGGTVFLDEIGEISPSAQIKLLRVIQTHKLDRLGGEEIVDVDVRILAATNKDLLKEVKNGIFREDLFYRINVIPIFMPPLRKRHNDIPLLARHFLLRFATEQGRNIREFSSEAMRILLDYPWPGNVRELENSVEHATVLAKGERIEIIDLPSLLCEACASPPAVSRGNLREDDKILIKEVLLENEKVLLKEILEECDWNKKKAAQRLGISRTTLYDKLKKHQITKLPTVH